MKCVCQILFTKQCCSILFNARSTLFIDCKGRSAKLHVCRALGCAIHESFTESEIEETTEAMLSWRNAKKKTNPNKFGPKFLGDFQRKALKVRIDHRKTLWSEQINKATILGDKLAVRKRQFAVGLLHGAANQSLCDLRNAPSAIFLKTPFRCYSDWLKGLLSSERVRCDWLQQICKWAC